VLNRRLTYQDFFVLGVQQREKGTVVEKKCYRYYYDALNRITSAIDDTGNYDLTSVSYDKNGNITKLKRKGHLNTGATNFGTMDDLTYSYDSGNKLMKVADAAIIDQFGFKDDALNTTADTSDDYTYDSNGNLLTDTNKGITSILYNHLDLPTEIKFDNSNTKKINYTYGADGTKLRKVVNDGGAITTLDYTGNGAVYENNTLQFIPHAEGYITPEGGGFRYVYQYRDHIDNIRLSYSDADGNGSISQSEIIQENNYQPFGLKMRGFNNNTNSLGNSMAERYMFGGKEFDDSFNETLNTYDFGARNYDPALGRWMNIDPLADQMRRHSPYNYAFDNPIYFIDPDGMAPQGCCGDPIGGNPFRLLRTVLKNKDKIINKAKSIASAIGKNVKNAINNAELNVSLGPQIGVDVGRVGFEANFGSSDLVTVSSDGTVTEGDENTTTSSFSVSYLAGQAGTSETVTTESEDVGITRTNGTISSTVAGTEQKTTTVNEGQFTVFGFGASKNKTTTNKKVSQKGFEAIPLSNFTTVKKGSTGVFSKGGLVKVPNNLVKSTRFSLKIGIGFEFRTSLENKK